MNEDQSTELKLEVAAIGVVLESLEPLSGASRERVVDYVTRALDIAQSSGARTAPRALPLEPGPLATETNGPVRAAISDIRSLREAKAPRSAVEMAALVGYYLADLASDDERKDSVDAADMERLFKQAQYPLPSRIANTLPNAASAGYFDSAGRGKYRLNPVGYNLVAHGLPAGGSDAASTKRKPRKASPKKAGTKKASGKKVAAKRVGATQAAPRKAARSSAAKKTS